MMSKPRKITRRILPSPAVPTVPAVSTDRPLGDIRALIGAAREQTARAVNSALVGLYWHIGTRIRQDVLREERAEYGEAIIATLSRQLTAEYGRGYHRRNLYHMIRFAEVLPGKSIVNALRTQLSSTAKAPRKNASAARPRGASNENQYEHDAPASEFPKKSTQSPKQPPNRPDPQQNLFDK
jgi:DUF1016 N-terminal domain